MTAAEYAIKEAPILPREATPIRRFELPDFDTHGAWIIPRVVAAYPHLQPVNVASFLRGIVYSSEFLFLFQDNSVALAQAIKPDALSPNVMIMERFVWAKDPADKTHLAEAAEFYERFAAWGRAQDAQKVVVCELTDVPEDLIRGKLGKLFERVQKFGRL